MDITVTYEDGVWRVGPDPAEVPAGTPIFWFVRSPLLSTSRASWNIYFKDRWPFHLRTTLEVPILTFGVTTRNTKLGEAARADPGVVDRLKDKGINLDEIINHSGTIGPIIPQEEGEYKYGIQVGDLETGKLIGDDDPMLIITRATR